MVGSAHEVGETNGPKKGFKLSSKGVSLGLTQMKASQCKDTSHQSTGHADDMTAFGVKSLLGLDKRPLGENLLNHQRAVWMLW